MLIPTCTTKKTGFKEERNEIGKERKVFLCTGWSLDMQGRRWSRRKGRKGGKRSREQSCVSE